ncbi:branched-chain amino acid ABC transporter permease [Dactylosporangium matsuzakiense]|uniref:Branched-chain amino acid ABC transporter permease n=1 Tax=Dactylosporangium matsuzakiense TaxID=53360 RepID=A0A9W6KQM0_9ACTN|nr:branched-chain amino acid ABC transporter permease [Dactylosporangium matsuzakiense]UWZ48521.1 branched-chain amino acid ABC transporter permease [Dactylosporangium matsuzakiense]GLL06346.1 branched-chain amino acid ABC transporter permease [Dactylosporangium matsuzakiense]
MTRLLSVVLTGLSTGSIYALVALGFVLLYKAAGVVNFAHGSLLLLGTYVTARTWETVGFPAAVGLGVLTGAGAALVIQRLLAEQMRDAAPVALAIMTIGVDIVLSTELSRRMGPDITVLGHPWGGAAVRLGAVAVPANRAIALGVAALVIAAFLLAFRFTGWGVAMRAAAEDPEAAALVGVRVRRVVTTSWMLAGGLAVVAGIFLAGSPTPGLSPAVGLVALRALPAAILGGLDSTTGALVGGLIVGVAEGLAAGYQDELAVFGRGSGEVVPYIVMIAVLLIRPAGLFGTRAAGRV